LDIFSKGSAKTTKQQEFLPAAEHKNRADAIASTLRLFKTYLL